MLAMLSSQLSVTGGASFALPSTGTATQIWRWRHLPTSGRPGPLGASTTCGSYAHAGATLQRCRSDGLSRQVFVAGVAAWLGIAVKLSRRSFALPRQRLGRAVVHAITEQDAHADSVKTWLDTVVIAHGFCPWAGPARDDGQIRVVTTTAETPDGVLQDLVKEATSLKAANLQPTPGKPTTTLVVCPYVPQWADFDDFHAFYAEALENGEALMDRFGMKVVAFHPDFWAADGEVQMGDRVVVRKTGDERLLCGTVVNGDAETLSDVHSDDPSRQSILVQLSGELIGEEESTSGEGTDLLLNPLPEGEASLVRVPEKNVVWVLGSEEADGPEETSGLDDASTCRSMIARAPRPVLHLLRLADIDAIPDGRSQETLRRNEGHVRDLGVEGMEELLQRCS